MKKISFLRQVSFLFEYAALRLVGFSFMFLPWTTAVKFGAFLGKISAKLIKKRFKLTIDNIQKAFPKKDKKTVNEIAVKSWENMGMLAAEFAKASNFSSVQLSKHCKFENTDKVKSCIDKGKPVILHLGHFTNWEVTGLALHSLGGKSCAVARHIRNPHIDNWITQMRKRFGLEIIGHRDPFFSCVKHLKKGYMLAILMDQNMPAGELFAPFLGRMCSVSPLTALLSLKTQTPIFPSKVIRDKKGIIKAVFEEPIIPDKKYSEQALYRIITELNKRLENWVTANPHLWLWAHNRWKREGDAAKGKIARVTDEK